MNLTDNSFSDFKINNSYKHWFAFVFKIEGTSMKAIQKIFRIKQKRF